MRIVEGFFQPIAQKKNVFQNEVLQVTACLGLYAQGCIFKFLYFVQVSFTEKIRLYPFLRYVFIFLTFNFTFTAVSVYSYMQLYLAL